MPKLIIISKIIYRETTLEILLISCRFCLRHNKPREKVLKKVNQRLQVLPKCHPETLR